jgi:hypothetical protein
MTKEIFVSIDIETSGPIPAEYSLLSIGACLISDDTKNFYTELKLMNTNAIPQALACVIRLRKVWIDGQSLNGRFPGNLAPSCLLILQ